ncbi:hypothetical protein HK100_000597 [Physocladia obscura]|uniref:Dephospho-CoA kinase n=1 Tax=Physocladia obscura TaxID=109957 RepID=A0AAD5T995_9FUNG|nr:hypothetical protein HK100_000597 [Physocladia obscura]
MYSRSHSTVTRQLREADVAVVDADEIARAVVAPGLPAFRRIVAAFGPDVLAPDGTLDRKALAARVFADPAARATINKATHPYIRLEMLRQMLSHFLCAKRVVVLDTPLLFESGIANYVNLIVVVYVSPPVQKQRLIARDLIEPLAAQQRIDSQMNIEKKKQLANVVIDNEGSLADTRVRVDLLIEQHLSPGLFPTAVAWTLLFWPGLFAYSGLSLFKWLKL